MKRHQKSIIWVTLFALGTQSYADVLQTSVGANHTKPKVINQTLSATTSESIEINPYGKLSDVNQDQAEAVGIDFDQNPFIYGSGYHDTESDFEYMGARYYSADIGRFMAQDSYDLINRYNYANANPVMYVDADGHFAISYMISSVMFLLSAFSDYLVANPIAMGQNILASIDRGYDAFVQEDSDYVSMGVDVSLSVVSTVVNVIDWSRFGVSRCKFIGKLVKNDTFVAKDDVKNIVQSISKYDSVRGVIPPSQQEFKSFFAFGSSDNALSLEAFLGLDIPFRNKGWRLWVNGLMGSATIIPGYVADREIKGRSYIPSAASNIYNAFI